MPQQIAGTVAFVTGANRGIGRAIVTELVARGAAKVYAAARTMSSLDELCKQHGAIIVPVELDVRNAEQIRAASDVAGDVTLLVNNAGIAKHFGLPFDSVENLLSRDELDVNAFGTLAVSQAFATTLARNGGGTLVNIISVGGLANFPLLMSYSVSKAALHSITQATRIALAGQGTKVIGVYPGPVDTDMAAAIDMEKFPPARVAENILDAIEAGVEDVFPDPVSAQLGAVYVSDPKGVERAVAGMAV